MVMYVFLANNRNAVRNTKNPNFEEGFVSGYLSALMKEGGITGPVIHGTAIMPQPASLEFQNNGTTYRCSNDGPLGMDVGTTYMAAIAEVADISKLDVDALEELAQRFQMAYGLYNMEKIRRQISPAASSAKPF